MGISNPARYGYWLATAQSQYFSVPTALGFTSSQNPLTGQDPRVRRTFSFAMPEPEDPDTGSPNPGVGRPDFARVMASNTFPRGFRWADLWYAGPDGTGPVSGFTTNIRPYGYIYDPTSTSGQPYSAVGDPGVTPGVVTDRILPYQGFWLQVDEDAANNGIGGLVFVPQTE